MDLGVCMNADVLEDKIECARDGKSPEVTWNTRRPPMKLEPGWTNRLFVVCGGSWRGYFPLSGEVLWNPDDERAPCALIFDTRGWTKMPPVAVARFRGWRYVDATSLGVSTPPASPSPAAPPKLSLKDSFKDYLKRRAKSAGSTSRAKRAELLPQVPPEDPLSPPKDHPTGK